MIARKTVIIGVLTGLIAILFPWSAVFAQCEDDCNTPIIFEGDGVIVACDPLTGDQFILADELLSDGATISPDGRYVAFRSRAEGVTEAIENNVVFLPSQLPSDIWLWEVGTDNPIIIAGQPENATISDTIGFEHMIERSIPAWSPDGTRLAWSEFDLDEWTYQVMVYSLEDETIEVLLENPPSGFQDVVFYPYPPSWGEGGIVFVQPNIVGGENGPPSFRDVLTVFDGQNGAELFSGVVTDADSDSIEAWVWIDAGDMLALRYNDGHWEALDLETGERTPIDDLTTGEDEADLGLCETAEGIG